MQNQKPKMTERDVFCLSAITLMLLFALVMGYDKPKYDRAERRNAENAYLRAEAAHRRAYYDVLPDATKYAYGHPEYKQIRTKAFDRKFMRSKTCNLSGEAYMNRHRQLRDSLNTAADSVRAKLKADYIASDSAYVASGLGLERAAAHLEAVRADKHHADSLAKLPIHKLFAHNIRVMWRDFTKPGKIR